MRKIGLLILALAVVAGMSLASVQAKSFERDGNPYSTKVYPATKNQEDSVLADVHAYSCYITAVRALDFDPAANGMSLIFRGTDGSMYNLSSLDNGANYTRQGPLVSGSIRYPSSMCDLANQLPFAFYNRGWSAANEGAEVTWDDLGYGGGLWATPVSMDTTGRGVAGSGIYVVNAVKGTNGRIHALMNYWGTNTPEASLYAYSDDNGSTWSQHQIMFYSQQGTEDSLALFGGGPVVHDPVWSGYIAQNLLFCSVTGETLIVGSCGKEDTTTAQHAALMKYWYRISYDNGVTWTPFTYAPHAGQVMWVDNGCYDFGVGIDRDGYPHFCGLSLRDTTDGGNWGPNVGFYDYHQTSSGWVSTLIHAADSLGEVLPQFGNFALDADGNLVCSYVTGGDADPNNDVYYAWSTDNGATYTSLPVTTDAGGYAYPHLPMHIGAPGSQFPVYYQRGNTGFISWKTYQGVQGGPTQPAKQSFVLMQNRPNPVSGNTEIRFNLSRDGDYTLRIYNLAGQTVKEFRGQGQAGDNHVNWNAKGVANGMYFYRLTSGGASATKKLVVVK